MRRYLQNKTGICLIPHFLCILHIFRIWSMRCPNFWTIIIWILTCFTTKQKKGLNKKWRVHYNYQFLMNTLYKGNPAFNSAESWCWAFPEHSTKICFQIMLCKFSQQKVWIPGSEQVFSCLQHFPPLVQIHSWQISLKVSP